MQRTFEPAGIFKSGFQHYCRHNNIFNLNILKIGDASPLSDNLEGVSQSAKVDRNTAIHPQHIEQKQFQDIN